MHGAAAADAAAAAAAAAGQENGDLKAGERTLRPSRAGVNA